MSSRNTSDLTRLLIYGALIFICVYNLAPFLWMIFSSLKTEAEVKSYPATFLPHVVTLDPYANTSRHTITMQAPFEKKDSRKKGGMSRAREEVD